MSNYSFAYLLNLIKISDLEVQTLDMKWQLNELEDEMEDGLKKIGNHQDSRDFKIKALCKLAGLFHNPLYDICQEGFDASQVIGPGGSGYGGSGHGGYGTGTGSGYGFSTGTGTGTGTDTTSTGTGWGTGKGTGTVTSTGTGRGANKNTWAGNATRTGTHKGSSTRIGRSLLRSVVECSTKVCSEVCNMLKTQIDRVMDTIFQIESRMNKMEDRFHTDMTKFCHQTPKNHLKIKSLCKFANLFNNPIYNICEEGFNADQIIEPEEIYGYSRDHTADREYVPHSTGTETGIGEKGIRVGNSMQQIRNTETQNLTGYCSSTGTNIITVTDTRIATEGFPRSTVDCNANVCSGEVPNLIKAQIAELSDTIFSIKSNMNKMKGSLQYQMNNIGNELNYPDLDFKITALCKLASLFNNPSYDMCEEGFDASQVFATGGYDYGTGSTGIGTGTGTGDGLVHWQCTGEGTGSESGIQIQVCVFSPSNVAFLSSL